MIRRGGGYTAPIPGPDPGACPDCGSWRKAGMIHECDDAEQALPDGVRSAIAVYVAVVADEDASESAVLEADQALAEQIQRTDQAWEEIARLREFGEHYSGAAQDAWDRIEVLEKALREIADFAEYCERHAAGPDKGWFADYEVGRKLRAILSEAAGSAAPGGAAEPCPSCGPDGTNEIHFDRSLCACGAMHHYCDVCGLQTEDCDDDAAVVSTEPTP